MAAQQELQVQKKRQQETREEATIPARIFVPDADIYESEDVLTVILEMPGVAKDNVKVGVEDGVLMVEDNWICRNTKGCARFIPNTTSVTTREASSFRARSIRTRSLPR